ncbi:MAG TPA: trypsin-like peptidase domain-containing protein [Aggregatilineales bacterium]|nr:trypsin-like peptidase domain-containing protein [Anaerolineae bacterium]HUN06220.1 trypsin-like peptidase domain-containing protein [Aggregatilineales bacterium]
MNQEVLSLLASLNADMADAIDRVHRSLVHISNGRGAGAGTIWHPDGLIVTNAHVVHGRHDLKVSLPDGRRLPARLLAADPDRDLAALSVDATDLPTIEIGDSRQVRPGQWVMAVGHPWGIQGSVTSGVVIGSGDALPEMRPGRDWIALSLHMRPGHSGGPLVDSQARLIGINTMITGPDVGFAIPVQTVKLFLKEALGSRETIV